MELRTFTLTDFCSAEPTPPRRKYPHFIEVITSSEDRGFVLVNLRDLADALRGDPIWASTENERTNDTFISYKYIRALASVKAKEPIHTPWLSFKKGRIRVVDGRHRLYALLNEEYTHALIVADPPDLDAVRTLADDPPCA